MHELPVTRSILKIVLEHAERANAVEVTDIHLSIGDFSSMLDESIQFYWGIISEGSIAEHATLHFHRIPAVLYCHQCETEFTPGPGELLCPTCHSPRVKVVSGDDFRVDSIEIN